MGTSIKSSAPAIHRGTTAGGYPHPGWGMPTLPPGAPGSLLDLGGALRLRKHNHVPWPDQPRTAFQQALATILNAPSTMANTERITCVASARRSMDNGT